MTPIYQIWHTTIKPDFVMTDDYKEGDELQDKLLLVEA